MFLNGNFYPRVGGHETDFTFEFGSRKLSIPKRAPKTQNCQGITVDLSAFLAGDFLYVLLYPFFFVSLEKFFKTSAKKGQEVAANNRKYIYNNAAQKPTRPTSSTNLPRCSCEKIGQLNYSLTWVKVDSAAAKNCCK